MDTDTLAQEQSTEDTAATQQSADAAQADALVDPIGGESADGDAVQMILPPKPGSGPRTTDTFLSVDEVLAQDGSSAT